MSHDDHRLMVAYCLAATNTACDHVEALPDGYSESGYERRVLLTLYQERHRLANLWTGSLRTDEQGLQMAVAEARAYCTAHMDRLDEITREMRRDDTEQQEVRDQAGQPATERP